MSRLIRVGDQYINLDNVTKIEVVSDDEVVVYFLGELDEELNPRFFEVFDGQQGRALRVQLEAEVERVVE